MNSNIAVISLIIWTVISITAITVCPFPFSDKNSFLSGFVNHEFLSFMGVIVTITLASAASLFVEMNKLEDKHDKDIFKESKKNVKHSAYALISTLAVSVFVVISKPWLCLLGDRGSTAANCLAIGIIWFSIMIMVDLIQSAFNLDPRGI